MGSLYDFLNTNTLYIVLTIVLVIWLGIFIYLYRLDKRVGKLYEQTANEKEDKR